MANAIYGELEPKLFIQQDTRACLSACILSETDPRLGLKEEDVSEVLIKQGLYIEGVGTGLYPAVQLDAALNEIGLSASPVFSARVRGENERAEVVTRLAAIDKAVREGQSVIVAYPKRREGQAPFMHYSVIKGFEEKSRGNGVVVLDPSDVDGGVENPNWSQLKKYVTPTADLPVMAWAISSAEQASAKAKSRIASDGLPGFMLLARPLSEPEHDGLPIPMDTGHACSTAMTNEAITRQFANKNVGSLALSREGDYPVGYPRFVVPPPVRELSQSMMGDSNILPFPTRQAALAAIHPQRTYKTLHKVEERDNEILEKDGLFWLRDTDWNRDAWQHTGLGISSRQAAANLEGNPNNDLERRDKAEEKIKQIIELQTGADQDDIYLFPTGMAAIYWLNQALIKISDGKPSAQFGFPYTDTFMQGFYGPNRRPLHNVVDARDADYDKLNALSNLDGLRSVFTEIPSNPLLWTPNMDRLDHSLDGNTPIVIDDTIGTMFNIDGKKLPDSVAARVTSLTKFFASPGDVMGGSVVLRPESPFYEALKGSLESLYEDTLWYEDAETLAAYGEFFPEIMPGINANGEELAGWLQDEWTGPGKPLKEVYHPSISSRREYTGVKKDQGGYGGLLSMRFNNKTEAFKFFDNLKVTKGPSLGTYYTLGCLYTLLAEKDPKKVKKFGIVPDLIRLSVGMEAINDLKSRHAEAFAMAA